MIKRSALIVFVLLGVTSAAGLNGTAQEILKTSASENQAVSESTLYVVQMAEQPVVAYEGNVAGFRATKARRGEKINPNGPDVVRYAAHLDARHTEALNGVGGGRKAYDYRFTFNGFAAELTPAQADALRRVPGVVSVSRDEVHVADTSSTPAFLGLSSSGDGLWDQVGGVSNAGEGIIIGIVDSGIWPEHPSLSDRTGTNGNGSKDGKLNYQQIPGWHGKCVPGEEFTASLCNQKLIGAQYFNEGRGGNAAIDATLPWEYNSARDFGGHGTHTSTEAAGNAAVALSGPASIFGTITGIAPRARIAMYKALWYDIASASSSGLTSDLVAAIDQAVADGVDVINYSISGTRTNFLDPVQVAFLFAADAGVFVAASAGNSGPTTATVAHPSPWITTVAAGTHNRNGSGSATLGNGVSYSGASVATALGSSRLVDSVNVGLEGKKAGDVELCTPGTLDPAKVTGAIVLCKRGVIARVDKSRAVQEAGGVGMIQYNDPDGSLNADLHALPSVHVNRASGLAIKAYIAATGAAATASIAQATLVFTDPAPFTASFSSRGPLAAGGGDLLKPDLMAPGQDIVGGVAPPGNRGRLFDVYSGTSMSSPHVAGLAALLKQQFPTWTPMMIKSALMTTGGDVRDTSTIANIIFRQGAGHVSPNKATDPGLVFDAGWNEWLAFLCGTGQLQAPYCPGIRIDPSDLNVPSIAIGDLTGVQTVRRKLTNVSGRSETYTASRSGIPLVDVTFAPEAFTIAAGETKVVDITFTRTTAGFNSYVGGQVTWTGTNGHFVRIPAVIRPVALAAPTQVTATGGVLRYGVTFGYSGPFGAAPRGLVPAATQPGTVADDPADSFVKDGPGTTAFDFVVPAGASYARVSLFDDFTDGDDDLDLYVYNAAGGLVGSSGGGTSAEEVNVVNPAAGTYKVYVHGWRTDGPDAAFTLFTWALGQTAAGNFTVNAPADAVTGSNGVIELSFTGLAPATRYLGSVAYSGVFPAMPNPTIVRVDTPQ